MNQLFPSTREGTSYMRMLQRLDEVSRDALTPPVTEEEIANLHKQPLFYGDLDGILRLQGSYNNYSIKDDDQPPALLQVLKGKLFSTFGRDAITHTLIREKLEEAQSKHGVSRVVEDHNILVSIDEGYTLLRPNFSHGVACWAANTIIATRLRSQNTQLQAWLALGGAEGGAPIEHLIRVMKRPYGAQPFPYVVETMVEGYDSVALGSYHLEKGGAEGIIESSAFPKAITEYTRHIPQTGLLAPMAMRAEYFDGLVTATGTITPEYEASFAAIKQRVSAHEPYVPLADEDASFLRRFGSLSRKEFQELPTSSREYINDHGFPMREHNLDPTPPYLGEGCPATRHRIVHHSAELFQATVRQLLNSNLPAPVSMDVPVLQERLEAARQRFRLPAR